VLDTAVALTTWQRGESPNDDASTKKLLAYLLYVCEKYDVTIVIIGHSNKGKHEQLADTVAGSAAWINSLRQAFIFLKDQEAEHQFVVCTVKSTLTGTFAAPYRTIPVHTLFTRPDGKDSVLCKVEIGETEWGYMAAMELVDAALGRDREEETQTDRKDAAIMQIVTTVLNQLNAGAASVDRQAVEVMLGRKVNRRHWQEADDALTTHHNVEVKTLARGRFAYELKK
jgi:hypothetical protein